MGGKRAVVIGAPKRFRLDTALAQATVIRLAAAFAHWSGWELVRNTLLRSRAHVKLLTGLDFCQSEPKVLWDWFQLQGIGREEARLYVPMGFRPKVWIVESGRGDSFALVGSGNLSAGGLQNNVECFLYTRRAVDVTGTLKWFDGIFDDTTASEKLRRGVIEKYEVQYKKARKALARARRYEKRARQAIKADHDQSQGLREARRYFQTSQWKADKETWKLGVSRIRKALRHPTFDFDAKGWDKFYCERTLGHLIEFHKKKVFRSRRRLQAGLRALINGDVSVESIENRLATILSGQFKVKGFGLNGVLRILAAHQPKLWPVYNGAVREALLQLGRGFTVRPTGEGYAQFTRDMRRFAAEAGAPDMIALDAFFRRCVLGEAGS